jgi:hypothetical protein
MAKTLGQQWAMNGELQEKFNKLDEKFKQLKEKSANMVPVGESPRGAVAKLVNTEEEAKIKEVVVKDVNRIAHFVNVSAQSCWPNFYFAHRAWPKFSFAHFSFANCPT